MAGITAAQGGTRTAQPNKWTERPIPRAKAWAHSWFERLRTHLSDPRFWAVQIMIVGVAAGHLGAELYGDENLGAAYFLPASLYFFPVLYASLNFGREGAFPTALWGSLLAAPIVILFHHGIELAGESFQLGLTVFLAVVVATRVDQVIKARQQAELSEEASARSELKYRALFNGAGEPILVVDAAGLIQEWNAAAATLLPMNGGDLHGASIVDLLGIHVTAEGGDGATSSMTAPDISLQRTDGTKAWFQPVCTQVPTADRAVLIQVLLRDVSERRGFQDYAREIVRAQEEERERIAHELHDVSLQSAILICRQLDIVSDAARDGDNESLAATLADARRGAEAMGDELRHFSRDLRPLILEDLGLVPALRQLVLEMEARSAIHCQLAVEGKARRLDPSVELALFRVAQEALRNAERHSNASQMNVRVAHRRNRTILTVTDDGEGFKVPDLTALVGGKHLGLVGIRERARLVGGVCEIRSAPGRGTRVEVSVPNANRE
jgi:PAS domain S-box-containing protein